MPNVMTLYQKQQAVLAQWKIILGRNYYSQARRYYCFKKYSNGLYYSDCSSAVSYCFAQAGFPISHPDKIPNTVGLYNSKDFVDVPVIIKNGQIQNPEILQPVDILLFAGTDASRASAGYVGHVEHVAAVNGKKFTLYGHGSGRPRSIDGATYCKSRYNSKTNKTKLGHKGLIRVRRHKDFITDDAEIPTTGSSIRKVKIVNGNANIRNAAGTHGDIISYANKGALLTYGGETAENGWVKVFTGSGKEGWVSPKYAELIGNVLMVKITGGSVNVRSAPSTDGKKYGTVRKGMLLTYAGETSSNGWHKVYYAGKIAWVSGVYSIMVSG